MVALKSHQIFMIVIFALASLTSIIEAAEYAIPSTSTPRLTVDTISQSLRRMEYAVRGKVVLLADQISKELQSGDHQYPFDHIVYTNIGNPQYVVLQ